jgi:cysteine desulfurase
MSVYFDSNATARLRPGVRDAVLAALETVGNPSSVHGPGRYARRLVESARADLADFAGVAPSAVIFTGSATEANALGIAGRPERRLLVSAIEHPSIRDAFPSAEIIPVRPEGTVDTAALARLLQGDARPALVAVMAANNETGIIQPIAEIRAVCATHAAWLHVDAVQAAGRLPLAPLAADADSLALSAHKLGGPQGVGALILRDDRGLAPLLRGGGQERSRRAGTENVAGLVGFAAALRAIEPEEASRLAALRDRLEAQLLDAEDGTIVIGRAVPRLANTSCIALPGVAAETLVMALDLAGFAVSAGSACSSGKVKESAVLKAMGLPPAIAGSAVRISLGWHNRPAEIEAFGRAWREIAARLRRSAARA